MKWETVEIKNDRKGRTMPYASVGFGRISISSAACELIDNYDAYSFVELLRGRDENNKQIVGVRFQKAMVKSVNSLPIKRRKLKNGTIVGGIDICNKGTVEELFGMVGTQNKATRLSVKRDPDDRYILIICGE